MALLEMLRKTAELNLCQKCYEKYVAIIEPSIKPLIFMPLRDWRTVESNITQIVMKHKEVFKTDLFVVSLDEDSNNVFSDAVDLAVFHEIKKWSFKRKIDYLHKERVLQNTSYNLINEARKIRNKIHDDLYEFSEQDLALLNQASIVTSQIHVAKVWGIREDISIKMIINAEKYAEKILARFSN